MLNRTIKPELTEPGKVIIPKPERLQLNNGVPFLSICAGTQDVIKIEMIFRAGQICSMPPLKAVAANELIDEGTIKHSSSEIAEGLDNYGAYLQAECAGDYSSVTLYTLSRFLSKTLPWMLEIISEPSYPDEEVETYAVQGRQRLAVSMERVDYLARRNFANLLYGSSHAYGYLSSPADYDQLNKSTLTDFHKQNYLQGLFAVIVAGQYSDQQKQEIFNAIDKAGLGKSNFTAPAENLLPEPGKVKIVKADAVQTAIRIGRRLFNRTHPDFFRFTILNTVLGGYFGSRLMSNIREDKGYTYGIGSGLVSQHVSGYFYIATEVGSDVAELAVKEIYSETERLQQDLIPREELDLVVSYLRGSFQRSVDGPFAIADRYKTLLLHDLDERYFENYLETMRTVTPEELILCARQYLPVISLSEVIVGP